MPNQSTQSWQDVKMNWFSHHESVKLEYTNQFNNVTRYKWNDSIKSKGWLKWFNQINQLNIYVDLFWKIFISLTFLGKRPISLTFFGKRSILLTFFGIFWISSIDSIIPVPQSQRRRRAKISGATLAWGRHLKGAAPGIGAAHITKCVPTRHRPMIILVILRIVVLIKPMSFLWQHRSRWSGGT